MILKEQTHTMTLKQLESKCRNLQRVLTGIVLVGVTAVLVAAAPKAGKETVQTEKLEIVDGNGKVRVRLGPVDAGFGVVLYDADGKSRATLTDAPGGAVMSVSKSGGSISLMTTKDSSGISIRDNDGKARTVLSVEEKGPQIMLMDSEGKTVFSAPK